MGECLVSPDFFAEFRVFRGLNLGFQAQRSRSNPHFPRPPVFATSFARATADKTAVRKATTGRPVRPNGSFRGLPQKANSLKQCKLLATNHVVDF